MSLPSNTGHLMSKVDSSVELVAEDVCMLSAIRDASDIQLFHFPSVNTQIGKGWGWVKNVFGYYWKSNTFCCFPNPAFPGSSK